MATKRVVAKRKAVEYLGGACVDCKLVSEFVEVYDFHHSDPDHKDIEIAKLLYMSWERIIAELIKCVLLCANCHRVRHAKGI